MCGIFGYVGDRDDAPAIVLGALKKLEYRGYDSWGIAVAASGRAALERRVGKIGQAKVQLPPSRAGLGHTRWATHGGVTEANAHPHLDCNARFAVIHNGIVDNHRDLRQPLANAGHSFSSQTDTEVIAHLIEDAFAELPAGRDRLVLAVMRVFRQLRGLNAVAVLDVQSGQIAAAKSGSPLVIGWCVAGAMLASDYIALQEYTREVTFVRDGQAVLLGKDGCRLFDVDSGAERSAEVTQLSAQDAPAPLGRHADYMSQEIDEQPQVLRRIADGLHDGALRLAAQIAAARHVYLVGCGSASHAALSAQYMFARLCRRRVSIASGSEFAYLQEFIDPGSLVIALSQSGETIDVLEAVRIAQLRGARVVALVNNSGSSLCRLADVTIPLGAGPERCVLSTKSFSAKLALLLLAAHELRGEFEQGRSRVRQAADEIERLLRDERREQIRQIAADIHLREHLYVIGRGPSYPMALEAALKIKEVSYMHAEGFPGGELKHGVMALIEPGVPCLVLCPHDETHADTLASAAQVKARGALIIGIAPSRDELFDHHIAIGDLGPAHTIANTVPAQLLGYELARLRGHDPDKPRNLAKSVTVK